MPNEELRDTPARDAERVLIYDTEDCKWWRAVDMGVTDKMEEAHVYTRMEALKELDRDASRKVCILIPAPAMLTRSESACSLCKVDRAKWKQYGCNDDKCPMNAAEPKRFCSLSFAHQPHDTCDGSATPSASARCWRPMWELPQVAERTEMLFRKEWTGRDDKVRATHEVLYLWPDGVLTDYSETKVEPEELPTHWMPLPQDHVTSTTASKGK